MRAKRKRITDSVIKGLKPAPAGDRTEIQDTVIPAFRVRSTDKGAHSYICYAMFNGMMSRRTIARVGEIGLAEARAIAQEWAGASARGIDPAEESRKERAAEAARLTVNAAAATYFKQILAKQRQGHDAQREMTTEVLSRWGDWALADVRRKDVVKMLEQIAGRGAQRQAANIYGLFRTFCNWCLETDRLQASPCAGIKPKRIIGELKVRTRVLDDDELRAVWAGAEATPYPYGPFIKLLLLTGARKSEASDATWSEFDLDAATWVVPEQRFKSGVAHRVPLSRDAVALLADLPRWSEGDFVFSYDGTAPINGHSKSKARLDRGTAASAWQIHDLRRTVRTRLAGLGVPDTVAEQVIGHGRKGLARVYDQHQYEGEVRDALERWAARLRDIVTPPPENVLTMKRVRA